MKNYLIVGLSGTGKTTTLERLAARGYETVNMDDLSTGISHYRNIESGKYIPRPTPPFDDEWLQKHEWVWDEQALRNNLAVKGDAFFAGDAVNEQDFYGLFTKIFGLYLSDENEMVDRLQQREPERWENGSKELGEKLKRYRNELARLKSIGAIIIDATQSTDNVADEILSRVE